MGRWGVTHHGAPDNTTYRPAMPYDAQLGPRRGSSTGHLGPRHPLAAKSHIPLAARGALGARRGRAHKPALTGCLGALALTQARPGPRARRALPEQAPGVAIPHLLPKMRAPAPFPYCSPEGPMAFR